MKKRTIFTSIALVFVSLLLMVQPAFADSVTFSGVLRDATGVSLPDIAIGLVTQDIANAGGTVTAADGSFVIPVASGNYFIQLRRPNPVGALPGFGLQTQQLVELTQNLVQDLTLPSLVTLHVTVIDPFGNPMPGVSLYARGTVADFQLFPGPSGLISLGLIENRGVTDAAGQANLLLLPASSLDIIANPPAVSNLKDVTVTGLSVLQDAATTIVVPVVSSITAPLDPIPVNTSINTSASFWDLRNEPGHTASWSWGDGNSSSGTVTQSDGFGSVSGTHTYAAVGVYTVTLAVSELGESVFRYVVVYDPDGAFVTGGGQIDSPLGAYTAGPLLAGRASFGFVSKYQHGANIPTGQTQFLFNTANLNFTSTNYQWLVVSGARGQYKGSGGINGNYSYDFILTAVDGQVSGGGGIDKFRVKITDRNTNTVVYDNQAGSADTDNLTTTLVAGNIIIHP